MRNIRQDSGFVFERALSAVHPERLFKESVRRDGEIVRFRDVVVDMSQVNRLVVAGTGKGAAPLARAAEDLLGDVISAGAITVKYGYSLPLINRLEMFEAGHPIPDQAGLNGTSRILELVGDLNADDVVLFLLTGGGSSLLEAPYSGLKLDDLQSVTTALLACGAEISEINAVRKHLSSIKGGQLSRAAYPARVITLAISDVIGDLPEAIASGPTFPDVTTFADAWQVVEKYKLESRFPSAILRHLKAGYQGRIPETPKPGDPIFDRCSYRIIGNNHRMLEAARQAALELGYDAHILTVRMRGEARDVGRKFASLMKAIRIPSDNLMKPACLLTGGETTVSLTGNGKGGRNQELALSAAIALTETPDCLMLAAGSDGTDGPTDAAGAVVDGTTIRRAHQKKLNARAHLENNDAYPFFEALNDLVITGPTRTNVMDLVIMLLNV